MYDLTGKAALITGAGRENGIGAAIALRLAQEGADVVVTDICAAPTELPHGGNAAWEELTAVAQTITRTGVKSAPIRLDVTQAAEWETATARFNNNVNIV